MNEHIDQLLFLLFLHLENKHYNQMSKTINVSSCIRLFRNRGLKRTNAFIAYCDVHTYHLIHLIYSAVSF